MKEHKCDCWITKKFYNPDMPKDTPIKEKQYCLLGYDDVQCDKKATYVWINGFGKVVYLCKAHAKSREKISKRFQIEPPKLIQENESEDLTIKNKEGE